MTMPKMNGDQLARHMLSRRPDLPILLCTGFSERIDPEKIDQSGIKALLMKPVSKSEMVGVVRRLLDDCGSV